VKLLMINPNTTQAMTDLMLSVAQEAAFAGTEIKAVTGRFGGRYVASRATYAIAAHAAIEAYAEHGADADAVALACFGDPGLWALKEIALQPVIGMAEASCLHAASLGGRFGIVTGGERWGPMLREFIASIGLQDRLAVVETVAPTGAEIAQNREHAMETIIRACRSAVTDHGADSVILGGAGLAGLAGRIRDRVAVPLIDSVEAVVGAAERLGSRPLRKARAGSFAPTPPIETVGLAPSLAKLMAAH
jgi:allantoin racemase